MTDNVNVNNSEILQKLKVLTDLTKRCKSMVINFIYNVQKMSDIFEWYAVFTVNLLKFLNKSDIIIYMIKGTEVLSGFDSVNSIHNEDISAVPNSNAQIPEIQQEI